MKNVIQFLSEVKTELARIEWPKLNEFVGATIIVLILVVLFSLFLGGVDRVIAYTAKHIFSYTI